MNRGPWEGQGNTPNSNWHRSSSGGARPRNGSTGSQGSPYNSGPHQNGKSVRGRARMPTLVSTSSKEIKHGNLSQHNDAVNQGAKPKNPWKKIAPANAEVPMDLRLQEVQATRNADSKTRNQEAIAGNESRSGHHREAAVLNFTILSKLAHPKAEVSEIARKFTEKNAFADFLDSASPDCVELVIVSLGQFCEKNGPTIFHNAFIKIVNALGEKNIFVQLPNVIMQLPRSRATNLGSKEDRLSRLITCIAQLITEMLTVAPAFSCNVLGKNFVEDVYAMSNIPSVRNLSTNNTFDVLLDVRDRLKFVWEQHSKAGNNSHTIDNRAAIREYREELLSSMEPPDDFRMLNVMPNSKDLGENQESFLRPNKVKGSYRDVDAYLDVQFRLLREDFFRPLREGLVAYREIVKSKSKKQIRVDNIRIYQDVKIKDYEVKTNTYTIEFSVKNLKRVNWEGSKRLIYGSLLLLSVDHFETFLLFTVADRKPDLLAKGTLKAYHEGDALPGYATKEVLVMAESAVFFEAYRSVLVALQRVSPGHFPLQDHILCKTVDPSPPKYLEGTELPVYDLAPVRSDFSVKFGDGQIPTHVKERLSGVSILDPYARPQYDLLGLDPSQSEALYAALTRKVVVIQGPPGTGKTYLGLKIVQTLLHNKIHWTEASKRPILAICYTNHALDQFLEGMLKFTQRIVRIGSQSKCEALERFNLRELKKQSALTKRSSPHRRWFFEVRTQLAAFQRDWLKCKNISQYVEKSAVIHEDSLLSLGIITKEVYDKIKNSVRFESRKTPLTANSAIVKWLRADSVDALQEVLASSQRRGSKGGINVQIAVEVNDVETNADEEEWDKEDIDEIQGQRMQNDNIYERIYSPEVSDFSDDYGGLNDSDLSFSFAFTVSNFKHVKRELEFLLPQLEDDDVAIVARQMKETAWLIESFPKAMEATLPMDRNGQALFCSKDFHRILITDRWKMYAYWKNEVQTRLAQKLLEKEKLYRQAENELKDVDTLDTAEMIRDFDIVGITTTAAAKQRALLEHLKPKIVIVEEAAEVLEAHIITSISASCQHLILIGDHQQLRPSTNVYELARDYHLDVSLFERLILNGLRACVLSVQHRMRPEVARLIVPSIYPHLENHKSVLEYPEIRGVNDSVFFLEHSEREVGDSSDADSRSRVNPYEAEMSLALAKHLLLQGYEPNKITILTTYSGQLFHLRKLRKQMGLLQNVRITVVDNFQGEENDIIILSLVRSNEDASIGFLKTDNRICVALSRAKHGFYLIGNMSNLEAKSKIWRQIRQVLKDNGQIGRNFVLHCEVHDVFIDVARARDFPPEGGCFNKCLREMPCKHICPRICHAEDREHVKQKCLQKCTRSCPVGHPCPKSCYQDCYPCLTDVFKVLPCSHSQKMACYKDPVDEFCITTVIKKLPICDHEKETDCGRDPAGEKCAELCGMLLNCQHLCNLKCHKKSSHEKLPCTQPCLRTCPANHLCPKKCFEDCDNCMVDVRKQLPCGHEGNLKCWILPKDAFCNVKIQKALPNCLHTAELECSASVDQYRCTQKCGKILCNEGHVCHKRCFESCGNCFVRVERLLECGHSTKVECYVNPRNIRCKTPRTVVLPGCGHRVDVPCSEGEKAKCPMPCDVRLHCGHQCTKTCHAFDDPDHANYECNKPCGRKKKGCKLDHNCSRKCKEECDPCNVKVSRALPCGHSAFVECGKDDSEVYCSQRVTKRMECGHSMQTACSANPTRKDCRDPCRSMLDCGHRCVKLCNETCDTRDCKELVKLDSPGLCGHKLSVQCDKFRQNLFNQDDLASYLLSCPEPCNAILPCEHPCSGTCGGCLNGRLHQTCKEKCGRSLICGHNCNVDCASSCPPCKKKCEYRCKHSKCYQTCSEPCSRCMEPCVWQCAHYKCTRKCGEKCNRPICNEPCGKKLHCGHPCVGLCGEICPPLCRICHRDQLTEFILFGYEEEDDARFVYLEDCKHCIEVNGMDHWMKMEQDAASTAEIQMKCCPRCKTIIRTSYRYGNLLKCTLEDIIRVKEKLLNAQSNSKQFGDGLRLKIIPAVKANETLKPELNHVISQLISEGLNRIQNAISPRKKQKKFIYPRIDDDTRYMLEVQVDVIEATLAMLQNAVKVKPSNSDNQSFPTLTASVSKIYVSMKPNLLHDILDRTARVVTLLLDREKFATEEYQACREEVQRLDLLRAFYILKSVPTYDNFSYTTLNQQSTQLDDMLLRNVKRIDELGKTKIKDLLDTMAARLNTGLGISDKERIEIVRAMGMKQGHWYKCPNGHIYVITECGGAMQEGNCNECGARIGGGSHRLRGDNRLASEMDGARYAAWGDTANNMANFAFDF